MADITIDVNPQQSPINATPQIRQTNIGVEVIENPVNWGTITGILSNQTDLQNALDSIENDITSLQNTKLDTSTAEATYATQTALQSGLATKQDTLVSGTNIKTVNNTSLLGSGDITIDSLPSQTGQNGKFLTTDGSDASWVSLPVAPPILFSHFWSDHIINEMSYLRADTFSWQSGMVYQKGIKHLLEDILMDRFYIIPVSGLNTNFYRSPDYDTATQYAWTQGFSILYTDNEFPQVGDDIYYNGAVVDTVDEFGTSTSSYVTVTGDTKKFYRDVSLDETGYYAWKYNTSEVYYTISDSPVTADDAYTKSGGVFSATSTIDTVAIPPVAQTETIGNYTITYYKADDKHKICLADQETTVLNIYNATGDAKYFILDTTNTRFKLPRWKHNKYQAKAPVKGNGMTLGLTNGTQTAGATYANYNNISYGLTANTNAYGQPTGTSNNNQNQITNELTVGVTTDPTKSGIEATLEEDDMYLYFYVGNFSQSATEQTAGLNSELFNGKADIDLSNITNIDRIATALGPDISAGVSLPSGTVLTDNGWITCTMEDQNTFIAEFRLDGNIMYRTQWSYYTTGNIKAGTFYGSKGQTFTITTSGTGSASAVFYPIKGV